MMIRFFIFATLAFSTATFAQSTAVSNLHEELAMLRKQLSSRAEPVEGISAAVQHRLEYCEFRAVSTKHGKLKIGGLVQVWYQSVQNDNTGIIQPAAENLIDAAEPHELSDNETFRIRRSQLRLTLEIHENITAFVMLDPAHEATPRFRPLPTFPVHNIIQANGLDAESGPAITPRLLRDAYINFHDYIPHHDVTIGQFKPPGGEEAWRDDGELDFIERSMSATLNNVRDLGVMVHGTWFDDRLQYWVGAFNGAVGTALTDTNIVEGGNRSDDNDEKDVALRLLIRPVWNCDRWYGRLELGYARIDGPHGESGQDFDPDAPINGLNRQHTATNRQSAWANYRPNSVGRGWWLRGEWNLARGRFYNQGLAGAPTSLLQTGLGADSFGRIVQLNPAPVTVQGGSFSTGYKLSQSIFAERLSCGNRFERALLPLEFTFRYEVHENIIAEDLTQPDRHTDLFKTQAYTAGINYYLCGQQTKVQVNYIWIDDPDSNARGIREVRNNILALNFQVGF
jgi:hypothetical protein